ncbi:MAG: ABC transporter ATP-binding protein [Ramlibacter sp.]
MSEARAMHPSTAAPPAVHMAGIHKRFGPVLANDGVTLRIAAGTVHGLVGENGAGKSTLMSVLYGFYAADAGHIEVFGQPVAIEGSADAIRAGLGMVHQHFMLVENLRAIDNVLLGAEPHALLRVAEAQVRPRLQQLMDSTGLRVDLDALAGDLTVGDRQRLEILKALFRGARILILDEPTAVLTPQETTQLFDVLARLRAQGTTIVLITHKLGEVMRLCDHVTVMRAGRVVQDLPIAQASEAGLAEAMVGRKVNIGRAAGPGAAGGDVVLQAHGLALRDAMQVTRLHGLDLTLRAGEIVGVAGVAGNGQSMLLELLAGLRTPQQGGLAVGGETFTPQRWIDPRAARRLGIAHVPEDRQAFGLVLDFPAWESAVLGYEDLPQYSRRGWMRHGAMQAAAAAMMERFDVRPRNPRLRSASFSGGNQQKLVLAREIGRAPRVLLVGQPTRGVDIGAIEFIHAQLRTLRDAGCALLVVSSELEEILALADRVLVMNAGRITGDLPIGDCSEARLGMLMAGTPDPQAVAA